jgi:hypothetical protein
MKRSWGNAGTCGDVDLGATEGIVIEIPTTDVNWVWTRVIELDPLRCIGRGRHDLVDEDGQGQKQDEHGLLLAQNNLCEYR